jgi:alcohol dehydrogenase class IV
MLLGSLLSGTALANAGLGAVHAFAAVIGGMSEAPHGAICGLLLPRVMTLNHRLAVEHRHGGLNRKFEDVGRLLTGVDQATAEDGLAWIYRAVEHLQMPRLRQYGLRETDGPLIVERAMKTSSMKGNPFPLQTSELAQIYQAVW